MKYSVVLLAGGSGKRLGIGYNKVLYKLESGLSILETSLKTFIDDKDCEKIVLVINDEVELVFSDERIIKTNGGAERKDSVFNGLKLVDSEYVLIHDSARPYLKKEHLEKVKDAVVQFGACVLGVMSKDTIKQTDDNGFIAKTLDRNNIFLAQTPQAFKTADLLEAYKYDDGTATDDSMIYEALGKPIKAVIGDYSNIKITYKEDLK